LNSGLWVRRLLMVGAPFQGWCPASEVNDGGCPGKPDQLSAGGFEQLAMARQLEGLVIRSSMP